MSPKDPDRVIRCSSYEEAVRKCLNLSREHGFDLFRGQSKDWPKILPSLLRVSDEANKRIAEERLDRFLEWAKSTPQMVSYNQSDEALTAIAQHYGVPTRFLDLTYEPVIASIFSKCVAAAGEHSVIYCFKRSDLMSISGTRILEFHVGNLWRLEAQSGLFLEFEVGFPQADLQSVATKLIYPAEAITEADLASIYPARKSHLETVLDQFFFRTQVENVFDLLSGIPRKLLIRRQTYPGVFRGRQIPDFEPAWIANDPRWVIAPLQPFDVAHECPVFAVSLGDVQSGAKRGIAELRRRLRSEILQQLELREQISFQIEWGAPSDELCTSVINRIWDGLRAHPYSVSTLELAMATAILAVHRRSSENFPSEWEDELWGEVQHLDACPLNGHLDGGKVSKAAFLSALRFPARASFHSFYRKMARRDSDRFLHFVIEPWLLYDFQRVSKVFAEQLIPSMAGYYVESCISDNDGQLSEFWGPSFNPALLGFLSPADYRMLSPLGLERNIEKLILIHDAMTDDDMREVFCDALSVVLKDQKPFIVRFPDFSFDEREIWEVPEAISLCKAIVRVGGISVLEVFEEEPAEERGTDLLMPRGLSAFHVWLVAHDLVSELNGKAIPPDVWERFCSDLLMSNAKLEELCSMTWASSSGHHE